MIFMGKSMVSGSDFPNKTKPLTWCLEMGPPMTTVVQMRKWWFTLIYRDFFVGVSYFRTKPYVSELVYSSKIYGFLYLCEYDWILYLFNQFYII